MTIDTNFFDLMVTHEPASQVDFTMALEILSGCGHHCDGCFVNRKNPRIAEDLKMIADFAQEAHDSGMRFRELTLAPTDLFSAGNSEEILLDPNFQRLMRINNIARIAASAVFDGMDEARFHRIFDILDNEEYFRKDMILEFFVPIDIPRVLARDIQYISMAKRWVNFLDKGTPKRVDWSFIINIDHHPELHGRLEEITAIVAEEFHTIIEHQPSFMRTGKQSIIADKLQAWRDVLGTSINAENYNKVCFTSACKEFNSSHVFTVNYRQGHFHISPFVYEQIVLAKPRFELKAGNMESLMETVHKLSIEQYAYAPQTDHCTECPMLPSCTGRNVLSFMEEFGMKDCPLPRQTLLAYYDDEHSALRTGA